jgi:hypothetical protein
MTTLRLVAEIALGVLYAVGALFNAVYTLGHGDKFYGAFVTGAWNEPARRFLRAIILPNATPFTLSLILFQAAIATILLTRGDLVRAALIAGAVFSVIAASVSSPGGTAGNLALTLIQAVLALSR